MATLERMRKSIANARDLKSVVTTMKSLAAVSIRQYERAAESLDDYQQTVEQGFRAALYRLPPEARSAVRARDGGPVLLVLGSDHGMCGQFNEEIVQFASDLSRGEGGALSSWRVLAVGERIRGRLGDAGLPPLNLFSCVRAAERIPFLARSLLIEIDRVGREQPMNALHVCFQRRTSAATYTPQHLRPYPLDQKWLDHLSQEPWPTRNIPWSRMPVPALFSGLIREYLFASLCRAIAHSLASENASRLASMQAAEHNIDERLADLTAAYHRQRQSSITEELFDVVSGFLSLTHR